MCYLLLDAIDRLVNAPLSLRDISP